MKGDFIIKRGKVTGSVTQTEIIAAIAGKVIGIKKITLTASAVTTARLQDNSTSPLSLTAIHELVAGHPLVLLYDKEVSAPKTASGKNVNLTTTAGNVAFEVEYWSEP